LLAAARARVISRDALLTNEELQNAARELPGFAVKRAEVRVRHDPSFSKQPVRGTRSLIVVPTHDPSIQQPQAPPRAYFDALAQTLSPHRLLGERLSVLGADYTIVDVDVSILVGASNDSTEVRESVEANLRARLSDVARDASIEPWPLGRPVTCRDIEGVAAAVPGVIAVRQCRLAKSKEALAEKEILLASTAVAIAGRVHVQTALETVGSA
jgi:hypothetical protein